MPALWKRTRLERASAGLEDNDHDDGHNRPDDESRDQPCVTARIRKILDLVIVEGLESHVHEKVRERDLVCVLIHRPGDPQEQVDRPADRQGPESLHRRHFSSMVMSFRSAWVKVTPTAYIPRQRSFSAFVRARAKTRTLGSICAQRCLIRFPSYAEMARVRTR